MQRVDGALVAATGADLFGPGDMLTFVDERADGTFTTSLTYGGADDAASVGVAASYTCNDWTSNSSGSTGRVSKPSSALAGEFWGGQFDFSGTFGIPCNVALPVLCLEQ